jgi:hypothetical protein
MRARLRTRLAAVTVVTLGTLGVISASPASAAPPPGATGTGSSGSARVVDAATLDAGPQVLALTTDIPPVLGKDGTPAGESLPTLPSQGPKPVPQTVEAPPPVGSANSGAPPPSSGPRTAPSTVAANFAGVAQGRSNCGDCQPPDVNAALSKTQVLEAVNLRVQAFTKDGDRVCGFSLNTFLNTTNPLTDPRVQWDNLNNRFTLVAIPVPGPTDTPAMFIAASETANACGAWFVYRVTFSGSLFPVGTLLDYPYIGQDRVALLSSSNNFIGNSYQNSTAFAVRKSALYSGADFSFPAFSVAFSTAPVTVAGSPIPATTNTYFLASVPGSGYALYRMTKSAGPGTTFTLQANIASTFAAPTRRVNQPGTTRTLDPLDGRIVWSPFQDGNRVWFTHGIDLSGYPSVRYGAINTTNNTAQVAGAFRSSTSDDFNPSIGVGPPTPGTNSVNIFLNWAYTDTAAEIPTSATVDGVKPGGGTPNLIGTGLILKKGSSTSSNFRFGDYSSVSIDPTSVCKAAVGQEVFASDGTWTTRLARVGFC